MAYKNCDYGAAIADVVVHPTVGVASHQPALHWKSITSAELSQPGYVQPGYIRVFALDGGYHWVREDECERATIEEQARYWKNWKSALML